MWRRSSNDTRPVSARRRDGFTITELILSVSILVAIMAMVLLNQSTYTDEVVLSNAADEISSTISQAQLYATGVREFTPGSSEFDISYGLTFSLLSSGSDEVYIYFADRNGNGIYDDDWSCPTSNSSECLDRADLSSGNRINALCFVRTFDTDDCNVGRIDVSFFRPSIEARILLFDTSGHSMSPANIKGAKVILESPRGLARSVTVYLTGQISVQ